MLSLVVSTLLSGVIDNIPYVATMSPLVLALTHDIPDPAHSDALWWSLALGADFGGNMTAIGASANVVMLGIAARSGSPISFWEFTRKGAQITLLTVLIAAPYLWLRYFVFG
jgi:Na+/H+ antiporter NhaD/arsenite permease-like protein